MAYESCRSGCTVYRATWCHVYLLCIGDRVSLGKTYLGYLLGLGCSSHLRAGSVVSFFGYIALNGAIEDRRTAARASAVLALVGLINLPIIHFSVEWWNTLHQGATVTRLGRPSMDTRMLIPLLVMFVAFNFYFAAAVLNRLRTELLHHERKTRWVKELVN